MAALRWDPTQDAELNNRRRVGRPKSRWTDDISDFLRHELPTIGKNDKDHNYTCDDNTWIHVFTNAAMVTNLGKSYIMKSYN